METLLQLSTVLDELSYRDRQVFLLARQDGLKYREIADQIQVSINVVQKAMTRAMLRCYQVLYDRDR